MVEVTREIMPQRFLRCNFLLNRIVHALFILLLLVAFLSLSGCVTTGAVGVAVAVAKEAIGMGSSKDSPTEVDLSIHAGNRLNSDGRAGSTGTAVLTKIFYLKTYDAWYNLSMEQMLDQEEARRALGTSLVDMRELTLTPGQIYSNTEKVPPEATYVGIGAFFYAAAPNRWRYAFEVKDAKRKGLIIGAHVCALTVSTGTPVLPPKDPTQNPASLAGIQCRQEL